MESLALAGTASLGREQPEACLFTAQRQGARGVEGHGFAGQPLRLARALAHLHAGGGLVGRRRSAGRNRALEKLRERAIKLKIGYWVEQIGMQIDVVRGFTAFKAGRADVGIAALRLAAQRGVQAVPPKDSKDGRPGLCDRHSGQACGRRHASWGRSLQCSPTRQTGPPAAAHAAARCNRQWYRLSGSERPQAPQPQSTAASCQQHDPFSERYRADLKARTPIPKSKESCQHGQVVTGSYSRCACA